MSAARLLFVQINRITSLRRVLRILGARLPRIVGRNVRNDSWVIAAASAILAITAATSRCDPAPAGPLPAIGIACRNARLVGAVFAHEPARGELVLHFGEHA